MDKGKYYFREETVYIYKNQLISWISVFLPDLFFLFVIIRLQHLLLTGLFCGYFNTKLYYMIKDYQNSRILKMYRIEKQSKWYKTDFVEV
jgi:hypothetical protein